MKTKKTKKTRKPSLEIDSDGNCVYCGQKCFQGRMCDGQQTGGTWPFERGDLVEVLANKGDEYNDFAGIVVGYKGKGIVQVRDQEDNVWDVGENQCELVDRN